MGSWLGKYSRMTKPIPCVLAFRHREVDYLVKRYEKTSKLWETDLQACKRSRCASILSWFGKIKVV